MVKWPEMWNRGFLEDSKHSAGVCLGTIQARTHVQLALACQRSMICAQHKLRLTMHHVRGHTFNLGNECADHAAALGTFGLISSHNVATRWIRNNFDASVCFVLLVITTSERFWKDCSTLEQMQRRYLKKGSWCAVVTIGFFCVSHVHICVIGDFALSLLSRASTLIFRTSNGKPYFVSSVSTASSFEDYFAHNMWNPFWNCSFSNRLAA